MNAPRRTRLTGAISASLAFHLGLLLLLLAILTAPRLDSLDTSVMTASLKYVHVAGVGGGGGGSDQPSLTPKPAAPEAAPEQPNAVTPPVPVALSIIATPQPLDIPGSMTGLSAPIALAPGSPGGGLQPGRGAGDGNGDGEGPGKGGNTGGDEYGPGDNVTVPAVVFEKRPTYTVEAVRARIQGIVVIEAVVLADGTLARPRIISSLDPGLDRQALQAVEQWRFTPGRRRDTGEPVNVRVTIQLTFQLR